MIVDEGAEGKAATVLADACLDALIELASPNGVAASCGMPGRRYLLRSKRPANRESLPEAPLS
jgi:hypothetical protein